MKIFKRIIAITIFILTAIIVGYLFFVGKNL